MVIVSMDELRDEQMNQLEYEEWMDERAELW
jgi:hypothetical protein